MADLPVLDDVEQRILGSLMEKQRTVPATYPLSLSALRTACNQTSSREPVVDYDEEMVEAALKQLRQRNLVRVVWEERGRRTLKYHQLLVDELGLQPDERALVTVLLLRGAQAPGELRTRAERLHAFADRQAVEDCLRRMSAMPTPLVLELERRPGQQDHRWVHLLGPIPEPVPTSPTERVDRETVLADGRSARDASVRAAYDAVATAYADQFSAELDGLPFERWLLDRVAAEAAGPVLDAGCGPGHVTDHLAAAGADASGLDLSPAMVEEARARFPGRRFEVGDLGRLLRPPAADGWGAVVGWYSLIHLALSELGPTLGGMARVLRPAGLLVLGLHAGAEVRRLDSWLGHSVDLGVVLHEPSDVVAAVGAAGLVDVEWYRRGPITARGESTERLYVVARKPS